MEKKLVSKAEFARICGVTAGAVTKACRGELKEALFGSRVDMEHGTALEYLRNQKQSRPENSKITYTPSYDVDTSGMRGNEASKARKKAEADSDNVPVEVPANVSDFVSYSLGELIRQFGTDIRFVDWLKATQLIEAIEEKRIKNAVLKGKLISRDLVMRGVIENVNATHQKLLTDGARTIARRATAMHGAKQPLLEIQKFITLQIASYINPMKAKIKKSLMDEEKCKEKLEQ